VTDLGSRRADVESDDFVSEIADHLLAVSMCSWTSSPRLGCVARQVRNAGAKRELRSSTLEPPCSSAPVVEEQTPLDLDLSIPPCRARPSTWRSPRERRRRRSPCRRHRLHRWGQRATPT
jgi:hypothetical protein